MKTLNGYQVLTKFKAVLLFFLGMNFLMQFRLNNLKELEKNFMKKSIQLMKIMKLRKF